MTAKCPSYFGVGFCLKGPKCSFEHASDTLNVPEIAFLFEWFPQYDLWTQVMKDRLRRESERRLQQGIKDPIIDPFAPDDSLSTDKDMTRELIRKEIEARKQRQIDAANDPRRRGRIAAPLDPNFKPPLPPGPPPPTATSPPPDAVLNILSKLTAVSPAILSSLNAKDISATIASVIPNAISNLTQQDSPPPAPMPPLKKPSSPRRIVPLPVVLLEDRVSPSPPPQLPPPTSTKTSTNSPSPDLGFFLGSIAQSMEAQHSLATNIATPAPSARQPSAPLPKKPAPPPAARPAQVSPPPAKPKPPPPPQPQKSVVIEIDDSSSDDERAPASPAHSVSSTQSSSSGSDSSSSDDDSSVASLSPPTSPNNKQSRAAPQKRKSEGEPTAAPPAKIPRSESTKAVSSAPSSASEVRASGGQGARLLNAARKPPATDSKSPTTATGTKGPGGAAVGSGGANKSTPAVNKTLASNAGSKSDINFSKPMVAQVANSVVPPKVRQEFLETLIKLYTPIFKHLRELKRGGKPAENPTQDAQIVREAAVRESLKFEEEVANKSKSKVEYQHLSVQKCGALVKQGKELAAASGGPAAKK